MMKNLILLFLFIGTTILMQAQTTTCCDPCPPECCLAVCDADGKMLKTSTEQAHAMDATEPSIKVVCKALSESTCSSAKAQSYAHTSEDETRSVDALPQITAMVETPSALRSISYQIPTHKYKGEQ